MAQKIVTMIFMIFGFSLPLLILFWWLCLRHWIYMPPKSKQKYCDSKIPLSIKFELLKHLLIRSFRFPYALTKTKIFSTAFIYFLRKPYKIFHPLPWNIWMEVAWSPPTRIVGKPEGLRWIWTCDLWFPPYQNAFGWCWGVCFHVCIFVCINQACKCNNFMLIDSYSI